MNNSDHSDIVEDFVRRIVELEYYIENLKKRAECAEDALDGMKNLNVENKDDQLISRIHNYELEVCGMKDRITLLNKSIENFSKSNRAYCAENTKLKLEIDELNEFIKQKSRLGY